MKIETGTKVIVTDYGNTYDTYEEFYDTYKTADCLSFKNCYYPANEEIGVIMASGTHEHQENCHLYLVNIEEDNHCCVMGEDGIEPLTEVQP